MKLRFGLKTLLVLTSLVAIVCVTLLPPIVERSRVARLSGPGIQFYAEPRGQHLLIQFLGDSYFRRIVYVHLDGPAIDDAWLNQLKQFSYIEVISINSDQVTDAGIRKLQNLPNLMSLHLVDTQVTSEAVASLQDSSKTLRRIIVDSTQETGIGQ
ncbi:MAG: hypothetical protein Aurels2KO_41670 [Aureliella sp.]